MAERYSAAMAEKLRLGGMALQNGVLVHGPTSWGCAVRLPNGELRVASGEKPRLAPDVTTPFVRGPLRLAEAFALLPAVRRAVPEARLPFERPAVLGAMFASAVTVRVVRGSRLNAGVREVIAGLVSLAPAAMALRGPNLAAYHGAEHVSIGTYENDGERASKEHDRCGTHLVGPLLVTSAAAGAIASRAPEELRAPARVVGSLGAVAAAVEVFAWMDRNRKHPVSRALRRPGHELQARLATAEPSPEQLEVAEAALAACLEREAA
jgi:uncharacterized protein YqhQ